MSGFSGEIAVNGPKLLGLSRMLARVSRVMLMDTLEESTFWGYFLRTYFICPVARNVVLFRGCGICLFFSC